MRAMEMSVRGFLPSDLESRKENTLRDSIVLACNQSDEIETCGGLPCACIYEGGVC